MLEKIFIDKDISLAQTMPSFFYLKSEYYDLSLEKIFKNSWQFITDVNSLKSKIYPFTLLNHSLNEPLILTKRNDDLLCLSNVCPHRGSLLCVNEKNSRNIRCQYHGRVFDLEGRMLSAPGFNKVENFPSKNDNLAQIPLKQWKKFIFISLNPKFNISEIIKDMNDRLGWYPFDQLNFDKSASNEYVIDAHWSLYCENYLEGFHVSFVHKGLNDDIELDTYKTKTLENGVLQYTLSKTKKDALKIPNGFLNSNEDIYAYYYWIFPNIMLNFYNWGISVNIIEPINKEKTKIRFLSYPINGKKQPSNSGASLDKVEKEDQDIVLSVQKGIKSKFYNRGRYSSKHEIGVHHFHRLICKAIN